MYYKAYNQYKDSDIDWIKLIPNHWMPYKLKHVIDEFIAGGTPKSSNDSFWDENNNGIPWVAIGDMSDNDYVNSTAKSITREGLASKNLRILKKGTLIYSIFASLGKTSILNIDATTNQAILGLILSNKIENIYLKYYLVALQTTISSFSNENTQENLNSNIVKNMEIAIPINLDEQKQIANYLDKQTAKIDETIAKNKQLIELLEEKRVSSINDIFLKMDYPITKLKDILKVGGYIRGPFGSSLKRDELKYDGIPIYEQQHAIHNSRNFRYYIDEEKYKELIRFKIKPNDLIISCSGTIGKVSIIKRDDPIGIISQALLILRINKDVILPEFLKYFLTSDKGHDYLVSDSNGAAQVNISQKEVINKIPIKLPPLNIQKKIITQLDIINNDINKTIEKIQKNINLLEEYKSSLIYHVVTGKVDVMGDEI